MQFELYKDRKGEFRWRLRHGNGHILAISSEGYKARTVAARSIDSVKAASTAPVVEFK